MKSSFIIHYRLICFQYTLFSQMFLLPQHPTSSSSILIHYYVYSFSSISSPVFPHTLLILDTSSPLLSLFTCLLYASPFPFLPPSLPLYFSFLLTRTLSSSLVRQSHPHHRLITSRPSAHSLNNRLSAHLENKEVGNIDEREKKKREKERHR